MVHNTVMQILHFYDDYNFPNYYILHGHQNGAMASTVASQLEVCGFKFWPGSFCVEF